jgi:hypothetical protein
MINDLNNIAVAAHQYKIKPESIGGGGGSFSGFRLPGKMVSNDNAKYYAKVISSTNIKLAAVSSQNADNKIFVSISEDGNLYDWTFNGDFK